MNKILILILLMITVGSSHAQTGSNNKLIERKGFVVGASLGGGLHVSNQKAYGRFSVPNLKVGAMLNPRLGLILYMPGGASTRNGSERAFEGFFPTIQYWLTDKHYVNFGMGMAIETIPFYLVDYEQGPPEFNRGLGITASIGHELFQWSKNKTIDAQFRILYGRINYNNHFQRDEFAFDILIGFNLY